MLPSTTKLLVFDLETGMLAARPGFSSSVPYFAGNDILCYGAVRHPSAIDDPLVMSFSSVIEEDIRFELIDGTKLILVGHNIKFDLLYLLEKGQIALYNELVNLPVWDTMVAEYLLSAQQGKFASLKTLAMGVGVPKSEALDKHIEGGGTTDTMDRNELRRYCEQDLKATLAVAMSQMNRALAMGQAMFDLIMLQSTVTQAYASIEHNGMRLDGKALTDSLVNVTYKRDILALTLRTHIYKALTEQVPWAVDLLKQFGSMTSLAAPTDVVDTFLTSNKFWSSFLFGGEYVFKWKVPIGEWKSGTKKGQLRYGAGESTVTFQPLDTSIHEFAAACGSLRTKNGSWTVDESVLKNVKAAMPHSPVVDDLLTYRGYGKLLSTYLEPLPLKAWDGVVHPNINQTSTNTGRISQSNPNLQNQSGDSNVKRCFVPKSEDLSFIEADYKQLEMIVFAYQCRDPQLIQDLRDGVDIHGAIGRQVYGVKYTPGLRRTIKGIVFGMIYGGGAVTLAKQSGVTEAEVRKVISNFHKRYPLIRSYRDSLLTALAERPLPGGTNGMPYCLLESVTGRRYYIEMQRRTTHTGFQYMPSYTNTCNYPIQGMATGDIVPMVLLHVWNWIRKEALPISIVNTVHDSLLFEVPTCEVESYAAMIKLEMERAPSLFAHHFGKEFDLSLPVDVKYTNKSWDGPWTELKLF